jgi:hypothetical protein
LQVKPIRGSNRPFALDKFAVDLHFSPADHLPRRLARYAAWRLRTRIPGYYRERRFEFDPDFRRLKPPVRIHGYFQSELYFADVSSELRKTLVLRQSLSAAAARTNDLIAGAPVPVSIHVRRGDYLTGGADSMFFGLPVEYYRRATDLVRSLLGAEPTYFIFSDDVDWASEALRFLPQRVVATGSHDHPEEDLMLMSRCRHNIIANSTFSWWGAWLNPSPDKIVVAPRQWFTPAGQRRNNTTDLLPANWIAL